MMEVWRDGVRRGAKSDDIVWTLLNPPLEHPLLHHPIGINALSQLLFYSGPNYSEDGH